MIANRFNPLGVSLEKLTARSYSQEGLLHQWDAIENVAFGEHSDSAQTWNDLIGDTHLSPSNSNYSWADDAAILNDSGFKSTLYDASTPFTIETVFLVKQTKTNAIANIFSTGGTTTRKPNQISINNNSPNTLIQAGGDSPFYVDFSQYMGKRVSVVSTYRGSSYKLYLNGEEVTTSSGATSSNGTNTGTLVGFGWVGMFGEICSIRQRNVVLDADSIAFNYAIDKERFGL